MDCNIFYIGLRRFLRSISALAVFIMIAASCVKGGREVSLSPRRISFDSEGGTIQVHSKFYLYSLSVFRDSYNYTDRIGDELLLDFADLSDSYVFDWVTINITDDQDRDSFLVKAEKNDSGKERSLLLAVYSHKGSYSLSEIRQR